jgi:hypothetical protein
VPRFYCERWSGLSLWAHALRKMIAFQGGYLNTQDPAEVAFVRATDYFQRGLIVEQPISTAVPTGPTAPRIIPATWPIPSRDPPRFLIRPPALPPTASMPPKRPAPKHDRATAWLRTMLRDGRPLPAAWMTQQAKLVRISLRTLRRARMTAGVVATKEGMTGGWAWTLPSDLHGLLR